MKDKKNGPAVMITLAWNSMPCCSRMVLRSQGPLSCRASLQLSPLLFNLYQSTVLTEIAKLCIGSKTHISSLLCPYCSAPIVPPQSLPAAIYEGYYEAKPGITTVKGPRAT